MKKTNYKNLLSYKLLLECGDKELVEKVQALLADYENNCASNKNWSYIETEFDDERPNAPLKCIWSFNSPEYFKQLELVKNYEYDEMRFRGTLVGSSDKLVEYFEQLEKKFIFNPDTMRLEIIKTRENGVPDIKTTKGSVYRQKEVKRTPLPQYIVENSAEFE